MPANSDKPHLWKADSLESIDFYNNWFLRFAPLTYRKQRHLQSKFVEDVLRETDNLRKLSPKLLKNNPGILGLLRMTSAPPLARDRLMGLSYSSKNFIMSMEGTDKQPPRIPPRMKSEEVEAHLVRILDVLKEVADRDLFPWLENPTIHPTEEDVKRSASVVADRLCGAAADPIIRNAQEKRQLLSLETYLQSMGYEEISSDKVRDLMLMPPGTYSFRTNLSVGDTPSQVRIPIDCIISRLSRPPNEAPLLIEAKSAGDATNTNKRRKEEAQKYSQLKATFGKNISFILFLCGYFETGYLGYEAAEGIDWVWEHRIQDLLIYLTPEPSTKKQKNKIQEPLGIYNSKSELLESERLSKQQAVDISKSPLERNKLGQFSTPFTLAKQMVRFGETLLPPNLSECNVLEPACGSGVFFSAFSCLGPTKHHFTGVEIDSKYADICMNLFGNMNLTVKVQDFFKWFYDTDEKNRFKLLVTNPPYVRHHHLNHDRKIELQAEVKKRLGIRVSGLSGLYIYYMLLSHDLLTSGGVASWLIPSEFMYTNYGSALREYLKEHVTLIRIHRFQPKDVQFDDALVSSCVITYTKNKPEDQSAVTLTSGDYETPSELRNILQKDCLSTEKWAFFDQSKPSLESGLPLDALFHITRGLATGNNEFFLLGSKEVKESGIKSKFLVPVLPSPRYLKNNLIESDEFGTPLVKGVKFLISAKLEIRQLRKQDPNLATYLEEGEKRGVANGYICRNRKIWYAQENRQPPRFVASYMGRGAADGSSPIRFFLNRSAALATNVFLCLYPRPFLLKLLENHPEREEELLYFLNNIPDHVIQRMGRCYGGGLQKVEPKELRSIPLQNSPEWLKVLRTEQIELFPTKGGEDKFHYSVAANE